MTAAEAIDRSRVENRIVTLPWNCDTAWDLLAACDDNVLWDSWDGSVLEYLGPDWRVHLVKQPGRQV